jgi:hypothetical protein
VGDLLSRTFCICGGDGNGYKGEIHLDPVTVSNLMLPNSAFGSYALRQATSSTNGCARPLTVTLADGSGNFHQVYSELQDVI